MKFLKIIQKSAKSAIMLDILVGVSFALVACGSESGAEPKSISTVFEVNTKFELGKCTNELEGTSVYVMQENVNYTCLNGSWVKEEGVVTSSFSGLFSSSYYLWSSSSFIQEMINSSSGIQSFIYSSSDPAQNIRATSGFYVRFIPNIDSTSGWMPAQTFFPEIPQYLEKNKYKRNYCSFQGWALSSEGEVVYKDGASVIVSSDVNLYAKWYCWEPSFISSSSEFLSSSSSLISSSSLYTTGILYDNRTKDSKTDKSIYSTVTIGKQTWMAENLSFTSFKEGGGYCYNDVADSCARYGRLYTWAAAMDSVGIFSDDGKGCGYNVKCNANQTKKIRGICPEGWHLPTKDEFETLFRFVINNDDIYTPINSSVISKALRSMFGWDITGGRERGDNTYQFSVEAAGRMKGSLALGGESYSGIGRCAYFWTSTGDAVLFSSDEVYGIKSDVPSSRLDAHSVRCIKNSD